MGGLRRGPAHDPAGRLAARVHCTTLVDAMCTRTASAAACGASGPVAGRRRSRGRFRADRRRRRRRRLGGDGAVARRRPVRGLGPLGRRRASEARSTCAVNAIRVAHPDRRTRGGRHRRAPFQHQARGRTSPRIPGRRSVLIRRPSPLRRVDAIGATVVPSMNEALHTSEPSPRCGAQARGPPARGPRGEGAPSRRCVVEPPPTRRFIDAAASGATVSTRSMPSAARSPAADDLSR